MEDDSGSHHTLPLSIFTSQERRNIDLISLVINRGPMKDLNYKWTAKINSSLI